MAIIFCLNCNISFDKIDVLNLIFLLILYDPPDWTSIFIEWGLIVNELGLI